MRPNEKFDVYFKNKLKQRNMNSTDICKELARKASKDSNNYEVYKTIVSKWYNGKLTPSKDYLLDLADILEVSVEELLLATSVKSVPIGTRATAYIAAMTGNPEIIHRLFNNNEAEIDIYTYDEYSKNFLDYVIEFQNLDALRCVVQEGFLSKENNKLFLLRTEVETQLIDFIIKNDDALLFSNFISRCMPAQKEINHFEYFEATDERINNILNGENIIKYLYKSSPFSAEEWLNLNGFIRFNEQKIKDIVSMIPSVSFSAAYIFDKAVSLSSIKISEILDYYIEQMTSIKRILSENNDLAIGSNDFGLRFSFAPGRCHYSSPILSFVAPPQTVKSIIEMNNIE